MTTFTHRHALDLDWKPGPGQKWKDAPKAQMRVAKMTDTTVYYTYANDPGPGQWTMSRAVFERDYLPQATTGEDPQ